MLSSKLGVGFNLRLPWLDYILAEKPPISHLEIIADNWLSNGPHHDKLERIREDYDILFHCVGMNIGGDDDLPFEYLHKIKNLASRFQPVHISDHLCFQHHRSHSFHDLLPIPLNNHRLEICTGRIQTLQEFFGQSLLVENLSYYVEYDNSSFSEAQFLNQLCERAGCSLLLDLNNMWVNEQNLNHPLEKSLMDVDLQLVKEIHLAGPDLDGEIYVDTHGSLVHEDVVNVFTDIMTKISVPVIYERDNNLPSPHEMLQICENLDLLCKH